MSLDFEALKKEPRILIEAALKPVAGSRFQPTGFPDLGPATYELPDGTPMLLVESAQSMANRLEAVCWDEATEELAAELKDLPYVKVKLEGLGDGNDTTNSFLEFHRLNSPYIMSGLTKESTQFADVLRQELGMAPATASKKAGKKQEEPSDTDGEKEPDDVAGVVNLRKLAQVCFKYDPNSLVHGIFLEKIAGRLRHPRALSAFIEASGVGRADSGGVKFDRALPDKQQVAEVTGIPANSASEAGYVNVPFHRTEFVADTITAYFSLDMAQIRGYGLGDDATNLLVALSLWKVRKFLDSTMRLRTACELEIDGGDQEGIVVKRPKDGPLTSLPSAKELAVVIGDLIGKCKPLFSTSVPTELVWNGAAAKKAFDEKKSKKKKD